MDYGGNSPESTLARRIVFVLVSNSHHQKKSIGLKLEKLGNQMYFGQQAHLPATHNCRLICFF